jgi:hypothetical protein
MEKPNLIAKNRLKRLPSTEVLPLIPQAQGTKSSDRVPSRRIPFGKNKPIQKPRGVINAATKAILRVREERKRALVRGPINNTKIMVNKVIPAIPIKIPFNGLLATRLERRLPIPVDTSSVPSTTAKE